MIENLNEYYFIYPAVESFRPIVISDGIWLQRLRFSFAQPVFIMRCFDYKVKQYIVYIYTATPL